MTPPPARKSVPARRDIAVWAAFIGLLLTARASFADQYTVPSGSMQPTVHVGDRVLVSKFAYGLRIPLTNTYLARFAAPARGDVVVLDAPDQDLVLLKRVVAIPGDHVTVRGGALSINGRNAALTWRGGVATESLGARVHAVSLDEGGGPDFDGVVPPDQYLLLGDNRGNSRDGRYFGFVARNRILGRAQGVFLRDGAPAWYPL